MKNLMIAAILLSSAAAAAAQDMIRFKDGTADQECEISKPSYRKVDYDIVVGTRQAQSTETKRVAEIIVDKNLAPASFDFSQGVVFMESNNLNDAIARFERAMKDARTREVIRQTAAINAVRCHFWNDNIGGCLAAIQNLRAAQPESYYLKETYEFEIKCCLAKRDLAGAQAAITALENKGNQENLPEWAKSAEVLRAGLFEQQNKLREALAIYRKYAGDKDAGDDSKMGELRCLYGTGDWAGLNVRAQAILADLRAKKSPNDRLWTAAYNASGESLLHDNKPKEALLDFMQGVAVYSRSGSSKENEVSIARAGYACTRLGIAEKDKTKKDTWKTRAIDLLGDLKRQYGNSTLAAELNKAIAEVK